MRKLVILVTPIHAVGHVNACAGATRALLARGHRVIFVLEQAFAGKLAPSGFEEFIYQHTERPKQVGQINPGEEMVAHLVDHQLIGPSSSIDKVRNFGIWIATDEFQDKMMSINEAVKRAIEKYKPDLLYQDGNSLVPEVYYSGIPWVKQFSVAPIFYQFEDDLPPGGSGYPTNGDRSKWEEFNRIRQPLVKSKIYNDLLEAQGYPRFPDDQRSPLGTQILTVYAYPDELDYPAIRQKGWFNLEVFHKPENTREIQPLETLIPEEFLNNILDGKLTGKLIYVSMGSMGSANLDIMHRLVETLSKTNHKYIVSKGPRFSEYSLAENMWGDRYLPQLEILPHVDLVITHGGNNTVTETFYHGKPMIVLPLFVDQFDNAQRLDETGFGVRLDPFRFTEQEMIGALDRLLGDEILKQNLVKAAKRIQSSNRHQELADKIEKLLLPN